MESKKVIVIDPVADFCLLIGSVFIKKGYEFYYSDTLQEALKLVKSKLPDAILADKDLNENLESALHDIINSSADYDPDVIIYNSRTKGLQLADEVLRIFKS